MNEKELTTDHYDFIYHLLESDRAQEFVIIDPYAVAQIWKLGERDPSGCLFHILKTIARIGNKKSNTTEREIASIEATLKRFKEVRMINDAELIRKEEIEFLEMSGISEAEAEVMGDCFTGRGE